MAKNFDDIQIGQQLKLTNSHCTIWYPDRSKSDPNAVRRVAIVTHIWHDPQFGFGFDQMLEEQSAAHLPSEIEQGITVYRRMIERHHAAMMSGDHDAAMAIRKEANRPAKMLNGGDVGDSSV